MKLSEAITKGPKYWISAQMRKNPGSPHEWFVMLVSREAKQYMLVNEDETPVVNTDLNALAGVVSEIGVKEFSVFL